MKNERVRLYDETGKPLSILLKRMLDEGFTCTWDKDIPLPMSYVKALWLNLPYDCADKKDIPNGDCTLYALIKDKAFFIYSKIDGISYIYPNEIENAYNYI